MQASSDIHTAAHQSRRQGHRALRDRRDHHRAGRLWLDHLVHIPRYRPVGWTLTVGPFILVAAMSGSALAATTGLAAGVLLLGTATAGFHDLAALRPRPLRKPPRLSPDPA